MIKNYLKIAWRNMLKNKLYSVINIGGLAIGMAVSFMLLLYVYNELSFDKFNTNSDRLYWMMRNQPSNGEINTGTATPVPLAPAILKDFPEVDKAARSNWAYDYLVNYKEKALKISTMSADASILDMFTFDFIYGDKHTALSDQSSVIITQSSAKAIFGDINPVGQVIKFNSQYPMKVSAVIKDNPQNSSFGFGALMSWKAFEAQQSWIKTSGWGNYSFQTYVMLKPGTRLAAFNAKLKDVIGHYDPHNKENKLFLFPFSKLHLHSEFKNGVSVGGSIDIVRLFLFLAIGILLIACINFMNLSTARSERRAREVGVRKAVGALRSSLIQQFLGESLLMAFFAFGLSVLLMLLLLSSFNTLINLQLKMPYDNLWAWVSALAVTIITGLVAGSYPAIFLSSFKPVKVLKGQLVSAKATVKPRQVLVVIQFTFAIALILFSTFIYKQINYIKDLPIGYDKNGLIEMPLEGSLDKKFESFRQDAINAGAITDAALTSGSITSNNSSSWGIKWPGQLPGEDKLPIDQIAVTYHFINTYGLTLNEGHDFTMSRPADTSGVILNEAAVKLMRLKNPLGQTINWQGTNRTIIGIAKNFVWGSPFEPVKPAIIGYIKDWTGSIGLRLNPNAPVSKSVATLQSIYKKYNPEYPFEYKFTDEKFARKFRTEKMLGTMSAGFTSLAIIISCLGLFGLAAFSAEQRRKEIGIRKVLGASIANLWFKLSQEFVVLVVISFAAGSLVSLYFINGFLARYTFHTDISLWIFAATMILSVLICMITVSWQAIKTAWTNPVKSLRSE